jgi:hypothetical protein
VTTQIRLRNLIKITGINFECDDKSYAVYFTLHFSAFSKPFYTSKSVEIRNRKADWPEINCERYRNSSQRFICIRIWQTIVNNRSENNNNEATADKMLFLWGVYFSGLVIVSNFENGRFKSNTLLFHLDGGIFTSCDQINNQVQHQINQEQLKVNHCNIIPSLIINEEAEQLDKDCDTDRYSNSNLNNFINGNNNHSYINSNKLSPSSPPKFIEEYQDEFEVSVMDILNESMYHKVRYAHLNITRHEIQNSYTIDKLIQMQEIQREIYNIKEKSKLLGNRICMKSSACLDLNLVMTKPVFYEPQKQSGMGRTLSRLLTQAPPKPEILLKGHELKIKIECARFRIKLLTQERDRSRQFNQQLMAKREKLKDDNIEMETLIWNSLRTLNRENLRMYEEKLALQREIFTNVRLALLETRRFLLKELNEIYTVMKKSDGQYTINGIHLPDAEAYGESKTSSIDISIALGYVAHTVLIIAEILNVPLRNPVKNEGSRSKIIDIIKIFEVPSDRIFPLFCRASPVSNAVLYGVYLLNQNISQLKFMLDMSKGDLRATLANLWDLMNGINAEMYSRRFVEDVKPIENSASSMDSVPINVPLSLSPHIARRKSRSLQDFDELMDDFHDNVNSSAPDLSNLQIDN